MDNSKEGLMMPNRKSFLVTSFDSISEKQEEASEESNHKKKEIKTKIKSKLSIKNINKSFQKNILNDEEIVTQPKNNKNKKSWVHPHQKFSIFQAKDENPFKDNNKVEEAKSRGSILKTFKRRQSKKKMNQRNSMQDNGPMLSNIALAQLNESSGLNKTNNKVNVFKEGIKQGNNFDNYNFVPCVYLRADVSIISGDGTYSSPYEITIKYPLNY